MTFNALFEVYYIDLQNHDPIRLGKLIFAMLNIPYVTAPYIKGQILMKLNTFLQETDSLCGIRS